MKLVCEGPGRSGCGFVVLAPPQDHSVPFHEIVDDTSRHRRPSGGRSAATRRNLRSDGAIQPWELSADGRHIQPSDALSWHLLKVDERDSVTACIRYRAHRPGASLSDLAISQSAAARSALVRETIQAELACASEGGFDYVELGGWRSPSRCGAPRKRCACFLLYSARPVDGRRARYHHRYYQTPLVGHSEAHRWKTANGPRQGSAGLFRSTLQLRNGAPPI